MPRTWTRWRCSSPRPWSRFHQCSPGCPPPIPTGSRRSANEKGGDRLAGGAGIRRRCPLLRQVDRGRSQEADWTSLPEGRVLPPRSPRIVTFLKGHVGQELTIIAWLWRGRSNALIRHVEHEGHLCGLSGCRRRRERRATQSQPLIVMQEPCGLRSLRRASPRSTRPIEMARGVCSATRSSRKPHCGISR